MPNALLSKCQNQREKKRTSKVASKELKKAQLTSVLQSLSQMSQLKQASSSLQYESQLISAKTFNTKRQKKDRGPKPPTPEPTSDQDASEEQSVDSFYTAP